MTAQSELTEWRNGPQTRIMLMRHAETSAPELFHVRMSRMLGLATWADGRPRRRRIVWRRWISMRFIVQGCVEHARRLSR